MEIISGKKLADQIKFELKAANLQAGICPCLAMIDVCASPENIAYISLKESAVNDIGGRAKIINLPSDTSPTEILAIIGELNRDRMVHGILLQLPLPEDLEPFRELFLEEIVPHKDVDGFCPRNRGLLLGGDPDFISCAAEACLDICRRYVKDLVGKKVLLVGSSFDVIQPLALMFIKERSQVLVIPEYSPETVADCDVIIIEHGQPLQVKHDNLKKGALLIDAGFHWFNNRTCGNVQREDLANWDGILLPVPGGLGPLLIAQLMKNLSRAAGQT